VWRALLQVAAGGKLGLVEVLRQFKAAVEGYQGLWEVHVGVSLLDLLACQAIGSGPLAPPACAPHHSPIGCVIVAYLLHNAPTELSFAEPGDGRLGCQLLGAWVGEKAPCCHLEAAGG
jgi:hypothetical protein